MRKLLIVLSFAALAAIFVTNYETQGVNVNGQKLIQFSFVQEGESESWKVKDGISGEYANIEHIYNSAHSIELIPKNENITAEEVKVSVKVDDEVLENDEGVTSFEAVKSSNGSFTLKEQLGRFDQNKKFWDEDITLILEYGDKKEEIKLETY